MSLKAVPEKYRLVKTGTVGVTRPADTEVYTVTEPHNLGYVPLVLMFTTDEGIEDFDLGTYTNPQIVFNGGGGEVRYMQSMSVDDENIYCKVTVPDVSPNYGSELAELGFRYYVFDKKGVA